MSKFRKGLVKRVMAVILSGAMVMSNMTLYAAEIEQTEQVETVSEVSEPEAEETESKEAEKPNDEDAVPEEKTTASESESETAETKTEQQTDETTETETEKQTETIAETETEKQTETTTEKGSEKETEEVTETEASETETSETEASEEETTEESEDNKLVGGNPVDLSNGLKAGTEYGDDILTFTVLEDMAKKSGSITVDGKNYTGGVQGSNNPKNADDKNISATVLIPTKGSAFKINALKDAKITFILGKADNKTYYFVKDNGGSGELLKSGAVPTGAYDLDLEQGNTYYFCVAGSKIYTYDISWKVRETGERPAWADIAAPVISETAVDGSAVRVTVNTVIGHGGADKVEVFMYDAEGKEVQSAEYARDNNAPMLEFFPEATGTYTFKAVISRADEKTTKESAASQPLEFNLPLAVPEMKGATSVGGGSVEVKWGAVAEAEKYVVEVADTDIAPIESTTTSATIKDLTIGQTYKFTVYAVRGEEKTEKSAPIECKVTEKQEFSWDFNIYGNGTNTSKGSYEEIVKGEEVRIKTKGCGKIVPASNDGLAFYYTTLDPTTTNFTLSATAHVNWWQYTNGQEGFGLMAADSIGKKGSGAQYWTNSYQAVVSRVGYRWNGVEISDSGAKIDMKIGVGSTEKIGVTRKDQQDIANGLDTQPKKFSATQTAIDSTFAKYGAGEYNIVGNYATVDDKGNAINPPPGSNHEQYVDFDLKIQKNNTGYFVSYTDPNGKTTTQKYYDTEALNLLENDTVYVGVFASRNADVTFSNIKLTTISPENDEPREEREPDYVNVSTSILSGALTNSPDYEFMFASNWYGKLVVKDNMGNLLSRHTETDEFGREEELDYYNIKGSLDPDIASLKDGDNNRDTRVRIPVNNLVVGKNAFVVEFTPDKDWSPERDKTTGQKLVELKSYSTVVFTHVVEYRTYGEVGQTIYVSQDGKPGNLGTVESPLDIYTAVKYAQPGQTILLAGGRYSLTSTLQIPNGIDGKPAGEGEDKYQNYIKMMGNPDDVANGNRPVLDFNSKVAAVVTVGDYWYFKDFDVIRCKDGEKGIQASGSYCVFDRVDTYKNGSTGLQICRASGTDTYQDWPHDNLVLNCNSYLNVDAGHEDADGFAAKLTSGSNNVFDGCIAAFNADDGWDLFAKAQTGSIGAVTIKNSIAYRNGYILLDENGNLDEHGKCIQGQGNGNGFKMGGDGLKAGTEYDPDYNPDAIVPQSGHKLFNSLAFHNKSKGFDSNNAPNIKAYQSISFNNDGANISFSSYEQGNPHTDYELRNVISFRTQGTSTGDGVGTRGQQDMKKVNNSSTYYWDTSAKAAKNSDGKLIKASDFVSLEYASLDCVDKDYWRNEDGTINTHGFLQLKDGVWDGKPEDNPSMGGTPSEEVTPGEDTDGSTSSGNTGTGSEDLPDYGPDYPEGGLTEELHYGKIWAADINYVDYTTKEPLTYTGKEIRPEVHVRYSADVPMLEYGKDYQLKYQNNVNAGTATVIIKGIRNYAGYENTKTFEIMPIDVNDNSVSIVDVAVTSNTPEKAIKPTWKGKALKKDVDYTVTLKEGSDHEYIVAGIGNFTGEKIVKAQTVSKDQLMSKASVRITDKDLSYTGKEVQPKCEVKIAGQVITEGFTVEYANNIEVGKATLTVIGDGKNYFGSKSINFSVKRRSIKDATVDKGKYLSDYELNGKVFDGNAYSIPENSIKVSVTTPDGTVQKLKKDVDYRIKQRGVNSSKVTIVVEGINGYTGVQSFSYKTKPLDLNSEDVSFSYAPSLTYSTGGVAYVPGENFNVMVNGRNVDKKNYKLKYSFNNVVRNADQNNAPKVTVIGKNGLKGTKEFYFSITRVSLTENSNFAISANDVATNGKALKYTDLKKANVGINQTVNGKLKRMKAGRDYNRAKIEYYIDRDGDFKISEDDGKPLDINSTETVSEFSKDGYVTILVRVPAAESNKCTYEGYVDGYFRASLYSIKGAKVTSLKDRVFGEYSKGNGESVTLDWSDVEIARLEEYMTITCKNPNGEDVLECQERTGKYDFTNDPQKLQNKTGFVIVPNSYVGNAKIGTASFMIKGTGKYSGTKKVTFKIVSKDKAR